MCQKPPPPPYYVQKKRCLFLFFDAKNFEKKFSKICVTDLRNPLITNFRKLKLPCKQISCKLGITYKGKKIMFFLSSEGKIFYKIMYQKIKFFAI